MTNILVAYGDGIGPEITTSVLDILEAAKASISIDTIEIGEKIYLQGHSSGISDASWEKIRNHQIILKGPITTPLGKGYKSLNVTFRKALELFANIRPTVTYNPFINGLQKDMDLVIIRENEEDLYAGIEYRPTDSRYISVKLFTSQGIEKIIRYAFQYARNNQRRKVTCITKNNIMKITDGAFNNIFDEVSKDYPEITKEHMLVDIGAAKIASNPKLFDVIVTPNLYGDIISDIAAEVSGSIGLAGSANIGSNYAMFEAIHGSAPDIAGQGKANPSGLLQAAIMMLHHIKQHQTANLIQNAWLTTIESGIHTADIFKEGMSNKLASTIEFTKAIINNLGQKPKVLCAVEDSSTPGGNNDKVIDDNIDYKTKYVVKDENRQIVGVDLFIHTIDCSVDVLANQLQTLADSEELTLNMISQRGLMVWPQKITQNKLLEMLRCRFIFKEAKVGKANIISAQSNILNLQKKLQEIDLETVIVFMLYEYDGVAGFSKAQGQ